MLVGEKGWCWEIGDVVLGDRIGGRRFAAKKTEREYIRVYTSI